MNVLKKLFFKLNDREQILLLFSLWIVVLVCFFIDPIFISLYATTHIYINSILNGADSAFL